VFQSLRIMLLLTGALALLASCSNPGPKPPQNSTNNTNGFTALVSGWNEFAPGGETTCSDGSPYRFYVRPGHPEKLVVYLQGGGACWFRENCDPEMQPSYSIRLGDNFNPGNFGIFNFDNTDNPFQDYSVVMAPYCTADVHIGASDTTYAPVEDDQKPLVIHHQGRANMQAVLDWTYKNIPAPKQIFVTGSSAGAIPSPVYASILADHYSQAKIAQLGDAAGGYRRTNGDTRPEEKWGTFDFITSEPGFETLPANGFNYEKLYIAAAKANPNILFAQYDAAQDGVQKSFLALSGNQVPNLIEALQANHADIRATVPNFRAYIGGGDSHIILLRPEFYTYASNGTAIRDWVADLAEHKSVQDVTCVACDTPGYAGAPLPDALESLWSSWQSQEQHVEPFQIFDNVYYVGINWVAAYVIETSEGLILIDSLYGNWIQPLMRNMQKLGLNPADVKYVINTHGHFDHAGGSAIFQERFGSRIVMTEEDWQLAEAKPDVPRFYMPVPSRDIIAVDGDIIELGETKIELFKTPGHTEGVLSLRYQVRDGDNSYTAVTLGGVGLNFQGVERTETYLRSYRRLQSMQQGVSVSLPNHANMGNVLQRGKKLATRQAGQAHPFVDAQGYQSSLAKFVANAVSKLQAEKSGTAKDPLEELSRTISDSAD